MTDRFDGRRFDLAACGDDVTIYEWVRVLKPEAIRTAPLFPIRGQASLLFKRKYLI